MDISVYRSQFDIAILGPEIDEILGAQSNLQKLGHPVWRHPSENEFLNHFKENPTTLVLVHLLSLNRTLEDFLADITEIAPSVWVIAIGLPSQSSGVFEYFSFGVVGFAELGAGLSNRIRWSLDLLVERVVAASQVKMLQQEIEDLKVKHVHDHLMADVKSNLKIEEAAGYTQRTEDWANLLTAYEAGKSREDLLQIFMKSIELFLSSGIKVFFFKKLPSLNTMMVTHTAGVQPSEYKDLTVKLTLEEQKNQKSTLTNPSGFASLNSVMKDNFPSLEFRVKPLKIREDIDGIFVFVGNDISAVNTLEFNNRFELFKNAFEKFVFYRRIVELEINDTVTQLLTADQFKEKLDEELARGRRLLQPVSIVKISIDQLQKIETELGDQIRDHVVRQVAGLLKKTSRVNDIVSRTALNEFTLILPSANQQGAMIKAERLRRIIESTTIPNLPFGITFSLGVNEFPTFAGNAATLTKGALMALVTVVQKGGNKIGTAKAPAGYTPEYQYVIIDPRDPKGPGKEKQGV